MVLIVFDIDCSRGSGTAKSSADAGVGTFGFRGCWFASTGFRCDSSRFALAWWHRHVRRSFAIGKFGVFRCVDGTFTDRWWIKTRATGSRRRSAH